MPLPPHPSDYPQCLIIAGPYQPPKRSSATMIYEVALITNGRYSSTLADCRRFSSAVVRAKRERTTRKLGPVPIFTRFPGEDPVLLKET